MQTIVFDLDHTIIHCDSFAGFTRYLLLRRCWRAGLALLASPVIATLALPRQTRIFAVSGLVWFATVGLDEEALQRLMDEHVAVRFGAGTRLGYRRAIARLREHQGAGARVLIATGSVATLAERVCRTLGIERVEVVGSSLRRFLGGYIAHEHCHGLRKVKMLSAHGAGDRWDCVYTDSASDLPLLKGGARRVLVNPSRSHLKRISAVLGGSFEVVDWRTPPG